jgi:hypothetical protein
VHLDLIGSGEMWKIFAVNGKDLSLYENGPMVMFKGHV